jgi:hypothetical protein
MRGICTKPSRAVAGSIVEFSLLAVLGCGSSSSNQSPGRDAGSSPGDATVSISDDSGVANGGPGSDGAGPALDGTGPGSDGAGPGCDGPCNAPPPGLFDPAYTTTWNPGILADTPTGNPLGPDGLPVRATTCASVPSQTGDATSAIQSALNGCRGKNQVVLLAAGKYSVSATIDIPSGVVLRGAGSDTASGTILLATSGGPVVSIGTLQDAVCSGGSFDSAAQPLLTQDATKETSTVAVASASGFAAGDLALIDQTDTAEVSEGDCTFFKRLAGYGASERVEISAVSGSTLTLTTPLHWTFATSQKARVSRVGAAPTKWAGVESLAVQGGRPGGYPGQNAGGIDVSNAAYSWVKDVQVDGTTSGMPIRLAGTYRCVVRDSHVHNSYSYGFAQDNYGIVLACGAADDLVENNVARFMNKPILFNNSGGGNVIGYNYADNSWSCDGNGDDGFQEVSIDCHCAFPHMELMEGNWAPHMGATTTHGNAGYLTYFRNYASSQWTPSKAGQPGSAIVWGQPFAPQYANVAALDFPSPDLDMTVVGNVLGSSADAALGLPADLGTTSRGQGMAAATSQAYASASGNEPVIFLVDQTTVAWTSIWLTGNYDSFDQKVMWNASALTKNLPTSTQALPASLYYAKRPGWWPASSPWPWVGPDLAPKVGTLPAHARSLAFDYSVAADGSCTLNCANYCCSVGSACSL